MAQVHPFKVEKLAGGRLAWRDYLQTIYIEMGLDCRHLGSDVKMEREKSLLETERRRWMPMPTVATVPAVAAVTGNMPVPGGATMPAAAAAAGSLLPAELVAGFEP